MFGSYQKIWHVPIILRSLVVGILLYQKSWEYVL